jgi:hypothetical protein
MRNLLTILALFFSIVCYSQDQIINPYRYAAGGGGGGGNAYPTYVSVHQVASWTTTAAGDKDVSVPVQAGDFITAFGVSEDFAVGTITIATTGYTWDIRQTQSISSSCEVYGWTATAPSTTTITVRFTMTGTTGMWGGVVVVWRDSNGYDASNKAVSTSTVTTSVTSTTNNCAMVCINADWNVTAGARTWATINSITPTSGNGLEIMNREESNYFVRLAYWTDVGTAGAKTTGMTAPAGQTNSVVAIAVKGN